MHNALTGNKRTYSTVTLSPAAAEAVAGLVNLNEVVKINLIEESQRIETLKVIIRYDSLPFVKAGFEDAATVFRNLLNTILVNPPPGSKLFIYIKCEKEDRDVLDFVPADGFHHYSIAVYTNIITDDQWQRVHAQQVEEASDLIAKMSGRFSCHGIINTGCLYDISLPGKSL